MCKVFICMLVDFVCISLCFFLGCCYLILNKICVYKGVDYVVFIGILIKVIGDGKIFEVGCKGGYGNVVVIQYGQCYWIIYGYMSCFVKGICVGISVKQGQIIGYVGMMGLVIGLYLYYEFQINGCYVDLLSVKLFMVDLFGGVDCKCFMVQIQLMIVCMDQEKKIFLVLNKQC